jgi:nucleoside-diphosphate-sugar epimerase
MRIFLAGATGVIGRQLVPLLRGAGHEVVGTTRKPARAEALAAAGAEPVVVDVYDRDAIRDAVTAARPDVVIHQLTDLADQDFAANARLRTEGTRNLVDAALAAGVKRIVAQSIAWIYAPGEGPADEDAPLDMELPAIKGVMALEGAVAELPEWVVLRFGRLYGPGTWHAPDGEHARLARAGEFPATDEWDALVHVADAAAASLLALDWPTGPVNVVDDEPARGTQWIPVFCESVGAPPPPVADAARVGRGVSNALARARGWEPRYPSWREGLREANGPG